MTHDLSKLSPADAAVTMRSLPRRFGAALAAQDDEDPDALVRVAGPDGASALDHVAGTGRVLALLGGALGEVLAGRQPVLHAAVTDPGARPQDAAATDLEGALRLLTDEASAVADRIERASADQWDQVGRVADGTEMTAVDLARQAVQVASTGLRATESAMQAARTA